MRQIDRYVGTGSIFFFFFFSLSCVSSFLPEIGTVGNANYRTEGIMERLQEHKTKRSARHQRFIQYRERSSLLATCLLIAVTRARGLLERVKQLGGKLPTTRR